MYKWFFFWGIFQIRIKHQSWHEYSLWATFLEKKTLADQNVKIAAIFQDVRHFDTQNIRF